MKRTQWLVYVGLAVLLIGSGYGIFTWMNKPMGEALALQTPIQEEILTTEIQPTSAQPTAIVENATAVVPTAPAATPTAQPTEMAGNCGNTGRMQLLVIGLTSPTEGEAIGADAIRLVTVDFDQPSISVLTLPALLWLDTPVLADFDQQQYWLTAVYTVAYDAAEGDIEPIRARKATHAVAQTIVDNFGYIPDHYITFDDGVFVRYIDQLGGIEVDLPEAVDGTVEGYGIYPAGLQLLDGKSTLNFARLFRPNGISGHDVWGNLKRQNMIVKAMIIETAKPQNWTKIPGLLDEVHRSVITDLSLNQTIDLACMVQEVGESTQMLAVSDDMAKLDRFGRMVPDAEAIKALIAEMDPRE